ncbi:MAG: YeeE/YedE thiosulfate transporter family protein [Anaeromyxobacteraceae bacterium]
MIFPFESLSDAHRTAGLGVGVLSGLGFGFVLERSGFGISKKLVGQFYGYDMTVLKVMFTAILTAMLGTVILGGAGVFDLQTVQFNYPTFLAPMIFGGLLLGVGFITSGYCPGTSLVGAASWKMDGIATVAGTIVGGVLYAELEPKLGAFPNSGRRGTFSLPTLLHLPAPVVAAIVVAMAIGAFIVAEKVQEKVTGKPSEGLAIRRRVFIALGVLAAVGIATLALPTPEPSF